MRRAFFVTIILVGALASPAAAAPEDLANEVAAEVMSPFCEGVTLHDCPSRPADVLRAEIRDWAEQGLSKEQIVARLEARYGTWIHASPEPEGVGWLAWVLPAAAIGAGALAAATLARRWARRREYERTRVEGAPPPSAQERARLTEELTAMRGEPWSL